MARSSSGPENGTASAATEATHKKAKAMLTPSMTPRRMKPELSPRHVENTYVSNPDLDAPVRRPVAFWIATAAGVVALALMVLAAVTL